MKTKLYLLLFFVAFNLSNAFSHAMWIETSSTGKKGHAQEVKIFFGEYETNETDSTAKWFSNLKDFKLVLTAPNGSTKVLTTSADIHHYTASFTPEQNGTYKLSVVHDVAAIYNKAKIEYYAFADVAVGGQKNNNHFPAGAILSIRPERVVLKAAESTMLQLIYNNKPFAKQKLTVVNPDKKPEHAETDANGKFNFTPAQKGNYFIEAFTENKTAGKLNGQEYEKIWHLVTYTTQAK